MALVLVTGALATYLAAKAGGPLPGLLAAASTGCAVVLLVRLEPRTVDAEFAARAFDGVVMALPGAATVYFSFSSGGYFPGAPALAGILLAVILVLRVTLVDAPFAGFSRPLAVAVGALSLYSLWTLLSATWFDAPAKPLIEFDRTLVYLLGLLLFGSIPRTSVRLRWLVRGLALGSVVVATVALATRVAPDLFPTTPNLGNERLSFPLGYTNAVGILGVLGGILCLHIAASLHEPRTARALAAAALPVLGATVLLTFSRGAIGAGAIGVATYVVLGRPRGLLPALIATVPTTALAVASANGAELLGSANPTSMAAAQQGHHVAGAVAACALGAAAARLLLSPIDARLSRPYLPRRLRRPVTRIAWGASILAALVAAAALGAPGWLSTNYHRFLHTPTRAAGKGYGGRLTNPANTGRVDYWKVALRGFDRQELHGLGAGSYEYSWSRERPAFFAGDFVTYAHSLYVQSLHDLGLVGFLLVVTALVAILVALAPLKPRRSRSLYAALFAAALTWAIHAGVDWDWEMPAVTFWLFAVGGAALAASPRRRRGPAPTQGARVVIGLLVLLATVCPALLLVSQHQLDQSVDAWERGDCSGTIERAAASISTLEQRAEPYEAIAYCQVRRRNERLAVEAMEKAAAREPDNWRFRYGLALVRGAAGFDPLPDARKAKQLDPHNLLTKDLVHVLASQGPRQRERLTTDLARTQRQLAVVR